MLLLFAAAFTVSVPGYAQDASGWTFPNSVGDFQRVGEAANVAGTAADTVAQYERSANGSRTAATVYVYPRDSRAADASLEAAKTGIAKSLKSTGLAQLWSEGPFRVGKAPVLVGEKAFYKIGIGPSSTLTNLYYFDTGRWIVKIRMTPQETEEDTLQTLDRFVRDQPWDSLGLTADTCTGVACQVDRPMPTHGSLPERLALMLVSAKLKDVFPKQLPACDAGALETALNATVAAPAGDAPEPIRIAAACAPSRGMRASFLRMDFDQKIRDMLEREGPDGLSLRGPVSFVVMSNGRDSIYTQMYDGKLDSGTIKGVLETLGGTSHVVFARGDRHGKTPKPVIRFIE